MKKLRSILVLGFILGNSFVFGQQLKFEINSYTLQPSFFSRDGEVKYYEHLDKDGHREGDFVAYLYPNILKSDSVLIFKGSYWEGQLFDKATWYDASGALKRTATFSRSTKRAEQFPWDGYDDEMFLNGVLDGVVITYFSLESLETSDTYPVVHYSDSALTPIIYTEEYYRDGVKTGIQKEYYSSGKIKYQWNYENDKKNGKYTSWYENGKIAEQGYYTNNSKSGSWIFYYENGNVKLKEKIIDEYGREDLTDTMITYYENGVMESFGVYQHDQPIGNQLYYYSNGKDSIYRHYSKSSFQDSVEIYYYPSGKKMEYYHYSTDKDSMYSNLDGFYYSWYENGKLECLGKYQYDRKVGKWKYYSEKGTLTKVVDFDRIVEDAEPDLVLPEVVEEVQDDRVYVYVEQMPSMNFVDQKNVISKEEQMRFLYKYDFVDVIANVERNGRITYQLVTPMNPKDQVKFVNYLNLHFGTARNPMMINGRNFDCAISMRISISKQKK